MLVAYEFNISDQNLSTAKMWSQICQPLIIAYVLVKVPVLIRVSERKIISSHDQFSFKLGLGLRSK